MNKIAKVPVIMQMEALECGAACLAMILAGFGRWVPLEQLRKDCGVSRDGANALNIVKAARSYGLSAFGYRREPDDLKKEGAFPCIVHWNFNHFVVCRGFKGKYVYLNDPARGSIRVTQEEFDKAFTGVCIELSPGEGFTCGGRRPGMLSYAKDRLKGAKAAVVFGAVITLTGCLFSLLHPAFLSFFIDRLLTGEDAGSFMPFMALFSFMAVAEIIVAGARALFSLKINGKLAVEGSSAFLWKVLRLPMEFFSQRMAGDIQERQAQNASIAKNMADVFGPLVLDMAMLVFYLAVMLRYSVLLTCVGVLSVLVNLWVGRIISEKRINITRVQLRDEGKLQSATVSGISMIETIKASGSENDFFMRWAGYQASVNAAKARFAYTNAYLGMLVDLLWQAANYGVLVLGIYLTMQGRFSLGMTMFFQSILLSFINPAATLIEAGQTLQEMRTNMERIEDVMHYREDPLCREDVLSETTEYQKLSGEIELKNITFGYSPLAEPLIEDFSMKIKKGSRVAFTGASGCGKSTLARLISGLYEPWSGEIFFDGVPLKEINRGVFTGSLSVVDQDITLFNDTISENIKMWDETICDFEVVLAARDAKIHDDIAGREGGYEGIVLEGGKNLSGGQRQRLEIARVLAADPTIIILDEATSALDAKTEYELVKSVEERGITCIVIAHRLSTVRDCDEIIVLDHGRVVERGTHDELIKKDGHYAALVAMD